MQYAKLWKRILNEGVLSPGKPKEVIERLVRHIVSQTIIVDSRPWSNAVFDWGNYRQLAVPHDSFWCEGHLPSESLWGALVKQDKEPLGNGSKPEYAPYELPLARLPGFHSIVRILTINAEPRCMAAVVGQFLFAIDQNGSIISPEPVLYVSHEVMSMIGGETASIFVRGIACAAIELMVLMGCKNVALEPHENDPQQVRRAVKRHGGTPGKYRYHTLVVRPPGARSDAPAQDIGIMPRHVCRGHFAEYGPEFDKGLLFGRLSGRFYIPPHLKGDRKNGVVEKDYLIAPPAPEVA